MLLVTFELGDPAFAVGGERAKTIEFDIERGLIRSRKFVTNETVLNAFGQQTLLQVSGESTEKLVPHEAVIQQAGFTTE